MPSRRAKLVHSLFTFLFSSNKPLTKESLLLGRKETAKFGQFVRTFQPVKKTSTAIDGVKVDIIEPKNKKGNKTAVYLHGGGFVYGMTAGQYELANRLAVQANARVLVVHYSLAPEKTFPTQINEVKKVYEWLLKQGDNPKDIFFVGDSAGGNMSVATTLLLKDKKIPLPGGIISMSAVLDGTYSYPSFTKNENSDFMLSNQKLHFFRDAYLGNESVTNPLASPTFANLKGLPKIQLFVGDKEMLLDDTVIFSEKLKKAGVPYELHIGESLFHGYPLAAWLFPEAKESIQQMAKFINND
jgi:epsilon-lactone hydrolase